jgi:hypothetical protein
MFLKKREKCDKDENGWVGLNNLIASLHDLDSIVANYEDILFDLNSLIKFCES